VAGQAAEGEPEVSGPGGDTPPAATPASTVTGASPIAIQVASFRTRTRANVVLAQVTERTGLPGVVLPAEVDGVTWYRLLLGAFSDSEEARRAAEPLLRRRIIREVVTREIPEAWVATLSGRDTTP
jgi:septal ring-binding cell division protein DamX